MNEWMSERLVRRHRGMPSRRWARRGAFGAVAALLLGQCGPACTPTADPTPAVAPPVRHQPSPSPVTSPPGGVQFFEDFSSPASLGRFVSTVFHGSDGFDDGNGDTPNTLHPTELTQVLGDHDMSCGLPTTARAIRLDGRDRSGSFYHCAPRGPDTGHVMTSMNSTGYSQVDFMPNVLFRDVSRICWDVNQTRMGGRKWIQVAVIPESVFQQNGQSLVYVLPSLENDVAAGGHKLAGDAFLLSMLEGSTQLFFGPDGDGQSVDFSGFRTEDKARRFKHCMTDNGDGTISFELERENRVDRRTLAGHFPDGPVRVIFSDDTYDGPKGDLGDRSTGADPRATWHWDNITIT